MFASDHRTRARQALAGNWAMAVIVCLLASLLGAASSGGGFSINIKLDQETISKFTPEFLERFLVKLIPLLTAGSALGVV